MKAMLDIISQKMENRFRRHRDYCIKGEKSLQIENELLKQESQYRVNTVQREQKIIVSLTSFPARFEKLHLVIRSLLVQTMPPDAIVLYLDDDDIVDALPDSLKKLEKYGLQIEWRHGRIKPHKKYYYAIKEHPDDIVVTVDDDVMYPAELIESLYKAHQRFPGCVVATRAHRILFSNHKTIRSYNNWHWADEHRNKPSLALMATGVGGVLYPPYCMSEELLNQELFLKLSPNADDLWLKVMQIKKGTKVVLCDSKVSHMRADIQGTQEQSLNSSNVHKCVNDEYMERMIQYFHLTANDFGC